MLEANIKTLLANVRPEEVTVDPVTLYEGDLVSSDITVPDYSGCEYLEVYCRIIIPTFYEHVTRVPVSKLLSGESTLIDLYTYNSTSTDVTRIRSNLAYNTSTNFNVSLASSGAYTGGVFKVVGYKRRISQTSLESLIAVVSQPNLLLNTWHGSPKVRNQRNFNGDWSALAIGQYGLDGWFKYSATHKAQIIESGNYLPSKNTVVQADGAILGEIVSPADGGNWLIAVPFDADFMDACHASIKRPYSIETDARLDDCFRSYYRLSGDRYAPIAEGHLFSSSSAMFTFPIPEMRTDNYVWNKISASNYQILGATISGSSNDFTEYGNGAYRARGRFSISAVNLANGSANKAVTLRFASASYMEFVDALTVADVADDVEHRVVLG